MPGATSLWTEPETWPARERPDEAALPADHVGSLLRPAELHAARDDFAAGRIDAAELRRVEDEAIRRIVAKQRRSDCGRRRTASSARARGTWTSSTRSTA
jgi:hypothetical protein